ncbi:hypothetical protein B4U80_00165 [Leptotrombidium deliense]|uniref:C2H2-type domain-containing protein n=1 Tax=Leptotrombidium deliense TaxID=299467 RepID=A0A443SG89_9ACAR|nr:hypothetical protein B4U80_00165 [Leptotrombidium deliense]
MKPFQCKICNRGYNTAAALTSHMQNHKRNNNSQASNCGKNVALVNKTQNKATPANSAVNCVNGSEKKKTKESESEDESAFTDRTEVKEIKSESKPTIKPQETKNNPINNDVTSTVNSNGNHSHEQQVTCGFCGNKCTHLDVHIREAHFHHLLIAGLLQNTFYQSNLHKWPPFIPPPPLPLMHHSDLNSLPPILSNGRLSSPTSPKKPKIGSSFNGISSASSSSPIHHLPVPLLCNQCTPSPSFPDFESFRIHLKSHLIASQAPLSHHQCPYCGDVIASDLESHVLSCRLGSITNHQLPLPLLCNQCSPSPTFSDFESFRIHLKSHLMATQSSISSSLPLSHHQCPYCGDVIAADFDNHMVTCRLGTVTTQYGCDACNKMFTKPEELQKHLMDIHAHHLYQCSLCRDMFDSKVSIQVHFAVKHSTVSLKKFSM